MEHERIYAELYCVTRPASGGVVGQALGAIENALLDAKAKTLGVPVLRAARRQDPRPDARLLVALRDLARRPRAALPAVITDKDGVASHSAREVREKGFTALKTNIFLYEDDKIAAAGRRASAFPFAPELNVDRKAAARGCASTSKLMREGAGPDVDILLDLNFNAKTEGYLKILREIADLDMFWVEIDTLRPGGARLHPLAEPAPDLPPARR